MLRCLAVRCLCGACAVPVRCLCGACAVPVRFMAGAARAGGVKFYIYTNLTADR